MSLPFTSVVSLHTDEYGCGVAKFSKQLAKRLGVPFVGIGDRWSHGDRPLLSLKHSEFQANEAAYLAHNMNQYSVFWHDDGEPLITERAECVFYADPSLGPNGLWCPSLITPAPPKPVRLFTFGMAHKQHTEHFERVKLMLEWMGIPYHLRVSVGLHEGTSLSDATTHFDALKNLLSPENVTILGILSDEAVAVELRDCDAVLAFFEKGLRANNTTVHAALQAGKSVITNHDPQTPGYLKAATRNIATMEGWQTSIPYHYSWERLIEKMTEIYAATANRQSTHR